MTKMKKIILGVSLLALALFLGACSLNSAKITNNEPIKIGFVSSLTGDAASWGMPAKQAAEIAVDKINNEGGINGRKLELIYEDDKCNGQEAVSVFNKLLSIDKVPAVIGTMCSGVTLAMAPIAEQNKVLLLSAGSSAPAIKDAGDYTFSIYPLDNYEAGLLADLAYDKLGKTKVAMLYANNDYGKGGKDVFAKEFTSKGGQIILSENYLVGTKDFRIQLTKIKNSDAEVIFIFGQPNEMIPILQQIHELGITTQIIASSVTIETDDLKKLGANLANGVIYTSVKTESNDNSEYLKQEFKKRFNKDSDLLAALGYDTVLLTAEAIKHVGLDATKMKDYLYTIKNFPGASGTMSFDKDGTVIKDFIYKQVVNGEFVSYEKSIK